MFKLVAPYQPAGDQPQAIARLVQLFRSGNRHQVLLGVTGSGKTFTVSSVIAHLNRPTLVISHNKTLAAQLYQEYRDFFPQNAVGYFVSYYDYYQPESYIPQTDTYIEKETQANDLIDKLRLQATTDLMTRKDVIIVASVSCIYNLGAPSEYERQVLCLTARGEGITRRELFERLTSLQYRRSDVDFIRGTFRVRGETVDIWPAYEDRAVRVWIAEGVEQMRWMNPLSGDDQGSLETLALYPAKHFLTDPAVSRGAFEQIQRDLDIQVKAFKRQGKLLEAQRLHQRVTYDLEMLKEVGYVNGVENYSRYFDGRRPGEPPQTLLDYFRSCDPNFLVVIDESHISLPQLKGMYRGDRSRKQTLIDYGFRLQAALDNRPLTLDEFLTRVPQVLYTSATPDEWEVQLAEDSASKLKTQNSLSADATFPTVPVFDRRANQALQAGKLKVSGVVELLVRPTGLVDPEVEIRPIQGQIPDLVIEILKRKQKGERVLVTTLTKRNAEALTEYLTDEKKMRQILDKYLADSVSDITIRISDLASLPKVAYLHSDIATLDRQDVLDDLRAGEIDVLVGINLLREGLDLPEVSLVAILDADQEGFLRSKTSLIQTMGRAARHVNGLVILYAQTVTKSMQAAIEEVRRRRQVQIEYNLVHQIMPQSVSKPIRKKIIERESAEEKQPQLDVPLSIKKRFQVDSLAQLDTAALTRPDRAGLIRHLRKRMFDAADRLDFETAAKLRDKIADIKSLD